MKQPMNPSMKPPFIVFPIPAARMLRGLVRITLLGAAMLVVPPARAQAPGALGVSPTHIILEGRTRTAEVTLINRGDQPATYRVFFKDLRMTPQGQYEDIETPASGEQSAAAMLRYSPRQVRLAAGEVQTVRLLLRRPATLAEGEYRSHLHFQQLPPENVGNDIDAPPADGKIAVKMIPLFGVSIPVIVREGKLEARAALIDLALDAPSKPDAAAALGLRITRAGLASVRGNIDVSFVPRGGGKPQPVGAIKGISVLAPTSERQVRFHLSPPESGRLADGTLQVRYSDGADENPQLYAQAELSLP